MFKKRTIHIGVVCLLSGPMLATPVSATAAPITFADTPPGNDFKPPKPNVIMLFVI